MQGQQFSELTTGLQMFLNQLQAGYQPGLQVGLIPSDQGGMPPWLNAAASAGLSSFQPALGRPLHRLPVQFSQAGHPANAATFHQFPGGSARQDDAPAAAGQGMGTRLPSDKPVYTGVSKYGSRGRWRAQLSNGGKTIHLGTFETEEEAARAWDLAVISQRGERQAQTNFPISDYTDLPGADLSGIPNTRQRVKELVALIKKRQKNPAAPAAGAPCSDAARPPSGGGAPPRAPPSDLSGDDTTSEEEERREGAEGDDARVGGKSKRRSGGGSIDFLLNDQAPSKRPAPSPPRNGPAGLAPCPPRNVPAGLAPALLQPTSAFMQAGVPVSSAAMSAGMFDGVFDMSLLRFPGGSSSSSSAGLPWQPLSSGLLEQQLNLPTPPSLRLGALNNPPNPPMTPGMGQGLAPLAPGAPLSFGSGGGGGGGGNALQQLLSLCSQAEVLRQLQNGPGGRSQ